MTHAAAARAVDPRQGSAVFHEFPMSAPTATRRTVVAVAGILVAHAVALAWLGTSTAGKLASNAALTSGGVWAALACLGASRRARGLERRLWSLFAMSLAIWVCAQGAWTYHESWLQRAVPQPSVQHLLYRLFGAPLVMALLLDEEGDPERFDAARILDFVQVGLVFLFFYFDLYLLPVSGFENLASLMVWGSLDLSDVENWLLAGALGLRFAFGRVSAVRAVFGRWAVFVALYAATSSLYNFGWQYHGGQTGDWWDLPWTLTLLGGVLLAASWTPGPLASTAVEATDRVPGWSVNWTPAVVPLLVLALALHVSRQAPAVAFLAVFASVACYGARLVLGRHREQRGLAALRASRARYSQLVTLSPEAILVLEADRISFANPAAARLLAAPRPEDLVGRAIAEFLSGEAAHRWRPPRAQADAGTGSVSLDARRLDGEAVEIEASTSPFVDEPLPRGRGARLVVARDVTRRNRVEAEREALIKELEAKNAELERFTYTVSHDLKSPLVTIQGFLGYLERAAGSGDAARLRSDIARIRDAAGKMGRLLDDLLKLSRVGRQLNPPQDVPFADIVRDALALTEGTLAARGVRVEVAPDLPVVRADRVRLVEVLQNLLENAAKFMGSRSDPRIVVGARQGDGGPTLFVQDNGIGIRPEYHEKVFGLFETLDARAEGTGVGLALVARIVDAHGGRVWVESEGPGRGSTFCFTLGAPPAAPV
jgi:signal transduction histidine kinase